MLAIFLLLAANFQSIRLALAIVLTIPAVLCGVLLMLLLTHTTLNVQSFMGAIMAIGIAVANSILLVTFAERARREGKPLFEAVQEGAGGRLRAILMTATAMIFGMTPMAIGLTEGASPSAPLFRAVIGGLIRLHLHHAEYPAVHLRDSSAQSLSNLSIAQSNGPSEPILRCGIKISSFSSFP